MCTTYISVQLKEYLVSWLFPKTPKTGQLHFHAIIYYFHPLVRSLTLKITSNYVFTLTTGTVSLSLSFVICLTSKSAKSHFRHFAVNNCPPQNCAYSKRPKTERSVFRRRRNPNKRLFGMVLFGFRTFGLFERSDFEQLKMTENRTNLFGFQTVFIPNKYVIPNRMVLSEIRTVRISDVYCRNVQNPNVRLYNVRISDRAKLSEIWTILFGFQTFSKSEQIYNRTEVSCPKSEHVRISDVDCIWNRTIIRTE